jgi:uncharacterized membrane protein YdbT with pleckstrin-like domain
MITIGQEHHLGRKTFMLFLSRKTTTAFILIFSTLFVFILRSSLAVGIAGVIALGGPVSSQVTDNIAGGIAYVSLFLFLLGVIAFLLGFIVTSLQYRNYTFTLDEFDLKMRRGIMSRKEISISYRQIQAIDIVRTMAYRLFGLSRLVMITAGHDDPGTDEEADTVLDPIDKGLAEEVRDFLQRKIGVQVVESTIQADKEEKVEEKTEEKIA